MAFKAFNTDSQTDDMTLPWAEEYIKMHDNAVGQAFDIITIRLTEKGMMFATPVCKAFVYKSHVSYQHVMQFLDAWSGKLQESPVLQVQLTSFRPFVSLGVDDVRFGIWGSKSNDTWRQGYATGKDNPAYADNPLPLPRSGVSVLSDSNAQAPVPTDASGYPIQTSQEMPLEEPRTASNGVKGRNSRPRK